MKFYTLFLCAAVALALQAPVAAHAEFSRGKVMLASAEDPADNAPGDDYMDDSGDNVDDDEVPVFNLPSNDSGTESHTQSVTPAQSQYSREHPAQELEDEGDNDGDDNDDGDE